MNKNFCAESTPLQPVLRDFLGSDSQQTLRAIDEVLLLGKPMKVGPFGVTVEMWDGNLRLVRDDKAHDLIITPAAWRYFREMAPHVEIQPEAYLFESKSISNMRGVQLNPDLSCVSTDSTVYPLVKLELLEELKEELIAAFEEIREDGEDHLLNIGDCLDVIRTTYDKFKEHHS